MIKLLLARVEALECRDAVKRVAETCFSMARMLLSLVPFGKTCPVCGALQVTVSRPVVGETLIRQWKLDADWVGYFNHREGEICVSCGSSLRVRQLATVLLERLNEALKEPAKSVSAAARCEEAQQLHIAEINSCGPLHKFLTRLPKLAYSEFQPVDDKTRREDLLALSYADHSFDVVLHSDTIEHVPDIDRAISEIWRILKPGGVSIFSIPWVRDGRKTAVRACLQDGELVHLMEPSFHGGSYQATQQYLVFYEFAEGFLEHLEQAGFQTTLTEFPGNPAAVTLMAKKPL